MDGWLSFLPQCCDAHQYQDLATLCATQGICYDPLRPMGAVLWFSLPLRLGLPFEALIYPHLLLLFVSMVLSAVAALSWTRRLLPSLGRIDILWQGVLLFGLSALIHLPVFYSLVFTSLADAPAGLLALNGVWLLLLARGRVVWLVLAGLCLGLAAFVRVFYLYPLLGMAAVYALLWCWQKPRHWQGLGFLVCLLPLLVQYCATWQEKGSWSYLAPDESEFWTQAHFNSRASGYDTVLPFAAYQWFSDCAVDYGGIQGSWQQREWQGLACIFWQRYRFYFGSYAPHTYLAPRPYFAADKNLLLFREQMEQRPVWLYDRITVKPDAAVAPDGEWAADKVEALYATVGGSGALMQGFEPNRPKPYTFSIWLWAPEPIEVALSIVRESDADVAGQQRFILSPVPTRYSVTGTARGLGVHLVRVGIFDTTEPRLDEAVGRFGEAEGDTFYAWGAQLNRGRQLQAYYPDVRVDRQRHWSSALLWLNAAAMVSVLVVLWRIRRSMRREDWAVAVLPMLVFGESMLVVPEQRFIVVLLVMQWMMTMTALLLWYRKGMLWLRQKYIQ